jgi:uncharacterized damage-inducible protein DinB
MGTISYFRDLLDYNYWRNHKIIAYARKVQPWQFVAPTTYPFVSLHGTMMHTAAVEWLWRQRLQIGESPTGMPGKADYPTLDAVVEYWAAEEREWRAWLSNLTDADPQGTRTYKLLGGKNEVTDKLSLCIAHMVNHGTQHCAEMAQMLTDYGMSPGNIDLIYWLRERA